MKNKDFTELEIEIVIELANGLTVAQVAKNGGLDVRAMEYKVKKIMDKIGCKSIVEVVVHFFREKLIQ